VLLTAQAYEAQESDASQARAMATEASKLAPGLVPAAVLGARLAASDGDWRKGAKLLETAWRLQPHPDIAELYAHLRPGGSARDRLARIKHLTRHATSIPEAALARARAALEAKEFAAARSAIAPLLAQPTRRVALLMAELEQAESGHEGRAREWMARALRAAPDHAWTADGIVSDRWMPVSPVTGRLDAFEWKVPLEQISHAGDVIDGLPVTSDAEARWLAAPEARVAADEIVEDADVDAGAPPPDHDSVAVASAPPPDAKPVAMPEAAPARARTSVVDIAAVPSPPEKARPLAGAAAPRPVRAGTVIPMVHAPDDPGPEGDPDTGAPPREPRPLALP
jgi:HemY protein